MRITPIDIQQQQFKTRPLGYEKAGVDQFLEMVAEELERVQGQNLKIKEELARLRAVVEEMRQRESSLKNTLMMAQKMSEDVKANAQKEADILIAEAQLKGERIVRDAEERRIQLVGEIQEVKRQKISFESNLRALVESHMRLLNMDVLAIEDGPRGGRFIEDSVEIVSEKRAVNTDCGVGQGAAE